MQRHVFISHSAKDAALARRIAAALRSAGARTWMAPDDIDVASDWGAAIATAIAECAAMVLVLTSHSNASKQVVREVQLADAANHPIIPLLMERLELSPSLKYFLSASQWLDATASSEKEMLRQLVEAVRERAPEIAHPGTGAPPGPNPPPPAPDRATRFRAVLRTPLGMAAAALATVGAIYSAAQVIDRPPRGDTVDSGPIVSEPAGSSGGSTVSVDPADPGTVPAKPETRFRPLRIGSSVGGITRSGGTLGAFVADGGTKYLVMAMHLTASSDFRVGAPILQPSAAEGGSWPDDEIGTVAKLLPLDDGSPASHLIALVRLIDKVDVDPALPDAGVLAGIRSIDGSLLGEKVRRYGYREGQSEGVIEGFNATMKLQSPADSTKTIMVGDFLLSSRISTGGDAGALVVDSRNRAVGLIIAGNAEKTLIAPLGPALREFGVELLSPGVPAGGEGGAR